LSGVTPRPRAAPSFPTRRSSDLLEAGLDDIPAFDLDPESAQAVRQGRVLSGMPQADGLFLARLHDVPVALMESTGGTAKVVRGLDRKSTRLNSSHVKISYAVFCL